MIEREVPMDKFERWLLAVAILLATASIAGMVYATAFMEGEPASVVVHAD